MKHSKQQMELTHCPEQVGPTARLQSRSSMSATFIGCQLAWALWGVQPADC